MGPSSTPPRNREPTTSTVPCMSTCGTVLWTPGTGRIRCRFLRFSETNSGAVWAGQSRRTSCSSSRTMKVCGRPWAKRELRPYPSLNRFPLGNRQQPHPYESAGALVVLGHRVRVFVQDLHQPFVLAPDAFVGEGRGGLTGFIDGHSLSLTGAASPKIHRGPRRTRSRSHVARAHKFQCAARTNQPSVWTLVGTARCPAEIANCFYRITQEALRNVAKHAPSAAFVSIHLTGKSSHLQLTIQDDGPGFDPDSVRGKGGLGLIGMEERARLIQGDFKLEARVGKGTVVSVGATLPQGK